MKNNDNATFHSADVYDAKIRRTIPYYESFHNETINLVEVVVGNPSVWLDTGCGTGSMVEQALKSFDRTRFLLADPSREMVEQAKEKLAGFTQNRVSFMAPSSTQELL